ncbi:SsgA family sporulation/cell division regulator [Streptomyces sioyaensis]|uniref:SsgA family sporulation/cell division regulator n=1 Tax=Streptomyces sioyaensis TaxID=67364 RepID=UPI0037D604C8
MDSVKCEVEINLVLSSELSVAMSAEFSYRADDPFAVCVTFHGNSDSTVHWRFARELLMEGMIRPAGHGNVRVWPAESESCRVLCVALRSLDVQAIVTMPIAPIETWLERTLHVVALGSESEQLGIDAELRRLLLTPHRYGAGVEARRNSLLSVFRRLLWRQRFQKRGRG